MAHMNTRTRTAALFAEPVGDFEISTPLRAAPEPKPNPRLRRGRYISDSILERRRRMLEVAKAMIAEGGREGFTIRELGRRANVSVTTIYATYGDKEGLIAAAIQDYFDGLPVARARQTTSLPVLLAATDLACEAVLANKSYARQYAELYFSNTVDPRIYKVVQDTAMAAAGQFPWLQKAFRDGDVLPGLQIDYVMSLLANQRLVALHEWAQGRVGDEDLSTAIKTSFLIVARGFTRGPTQARVEAELKKLLRSNGGER
jgi:AcrR family transcriptional regulator